MHRSYAESDRPHHSIAAGDHSKLLLHLEVTGKLRKMSGWASKLFLKLLIHADWSSGFCYLSVETLIESLGKDRATMYRARQCLVDAGVLEIVDRTQYDPDEFDDIPDYCTIYRIVDIHNLACDSSPAPVAPVRQQEICDDKMGTRVAPVQQNGDDFVNLGNRVAPVRTEREREPEPYLSPTTATAHTSQIPHFDTSVDVDAAVVEEMRMLTQDWGIANDEASRLLTLRTPTDVRIGCEFALFQQWIGKIKSNPKVWLIKYLFANGSPTKRYLDWSSKGRPVNPGCQQAFPLPPFKRLSPILPHQSAEQPVENNRMRDYIDFYRKQGNEEMVRNLEAKIKGIK